MARTMARTRRNRPGPAARVAATRLQGAAAVLGAVLALLPCALAAQNVTIDRPGASGPSSGGARPPSENDGSAREEREERARAAAAARAAEAAGRIVPTQVVTVTGRAALGAGGRDAARRLAMEDALYLAALEGGSQVDAFSLMENGILVGESVLLRPSSRILDFEILSEEVVEQRFEVQLRAWVGTSPMAGAVPHRRAVSVVVIEPDITLSPDTPAWLPGVLDSVQAQLVAEAAAVPSVRAAQRAVTLGDLGAGGRDMSFDYAAIMAGATGGVSGLPDGTQALHLKLAVSGGAGRGQIMLRGELSLRDGGALAPVARFPIEATVRTELATPVRTLNVLAGASRAEVGALIMAEIAPGLRAMLDGHATRPLTARLAAMGDDLSVDIGRRDGLTTRSLGFVEGGETPWGVLRIVELGEGTARLRPVNTLRAVDTLVGREVRFIPGDP